jgi:uncharacterized membrane protein YtjA (UPF0391 family)
MEQRVGSDEFGLINGKGEIRRNAMLWTILIILLVLWALGFGFAGAAVGNLIHILLVLALVVLVVQLVTGRRAV